MRVYCTIMFYYVISQGFDNFHVFLNPIYPIRKREGGGGGSALADFNFRELTCYF